MLKKKLACVFADNKRLTRRHTVDKDLLDGVHKVLVLRKLAP